MLLGPDADLRLHAVMFPNGTVVADEVLERLVSLQEPRQLSLNGTLADDESLKLVGRLPLHVLALNSTEVTDDGLVALSKMPELRELSLCYLPITDEGLQHIAVIPRIDVVVAYETWISADGVRDFQAASPGIDVRWANPQNDAHRIALVKLERAGFLISRRRVISDSSPTYAIRTPSFLLMGSALHANRWLGSQDHISLLPQVPGITELSLQPVIETERLVTNGVVRDIGQLSSLRELDLTRASIGDTALSELTGVRQLENLSLDRTDVTDVGLRHLATLPNLSHLSLRHTSISDAGVRKLRDFRHLISLDLAYTEITEAAVHDLAELHTLEHLDISGNGLSSDAYGELRSLMPECSVD